MFAPALGSTLGCRLSETAQCPSLKADCVNVYSEALSDRPPSEILRPVVTGVASVSVSWLGVAAGGFQK